MVMLIRKAALPINKLCLDCGQVGGLSLTLGLAARPLGSFSIAGARDKVVTAGHFVEDPITPPG